MCLAAARGAIGEDGRIVPIQHTVEKVLGRPLVDVALRDIVIEDAVEAESLVFHSLAMRHHASREPLHRVVFRWVEDKALIVDDFDDRSQAFLGELGCLGSCETALAQEQRAVWSMR